MSAVTMWCIKHWITFFCLALMLSNVSCKVPDYIKPCAKGDNSCLKVNFKNVVNFLSNNDDPALKIQSFKGVFVPKIDLQATKELTVSLANITFTGLNTMEIIDMSMTDTELHLVMHCKELNYEGAYQMDGKILVLPIQGEGPMLISQKNFDLDYKAKLQTEERKGKKYFFVNNKPEDTTMIIPKIEKVVWRWDNLFKGDPQLGPETNRFLNENWREVFNEVKVALEQAGAFSLINPIVNGFLRHIPIDELYA